MQRIVGAKKVRYQVLCTLTTFKKPGVVTFYRGGDEREPFFGAKSPLPITKTVIILEERCCGLRETGDYV